VAPVITDVLFEQFLIRRAVFHSSLLTAKSVELVV